MKIFYVITSSIIGGAQTNVLQLADHFKNKGDEVRVMSFPGGNLEQELLKTGIKFYPNRFFCGYFEPVRNFRAALLIRKAINDFQPDLIHCHSTQAGFLTRLAAVGTSKVIFTAHGWAFAEGTPFFRKFPVVLAERLAALFCRKIICVSERDRLSALKLKIAPSEKLAAIRNGTIVPEAFPEKNYSYPLKIVFAARMAKQKDPFTFIRALRDLDPGLKGRISVLIVGEGPESAKFKRFVRGIGMEKDIEMKDSLSNADLMKVFRDAHIFVLTSHWEGLPIAVLEAMANGMTVIASDVGGTREAVDGSCGFLVKRKNVREVKEKLEELIRDPAAVRRMGKAGFEKAKKEFSVQRMVEETERVYAGI